MLGLVLAMEAMYLAASLVIIPQSGYLAAIFATVLVDQTNDERLADNLHGLAINDTLVHVAQLKADDMAAKGYFSHNTPDGKTPWYWFDLGGYNYAAAGENLAVNFTDSKDVTSAWMRSESHRANIMNGNYTEIGIATAKGTYKGKSAIFVVQEFGRPSLIARAVTSSTTTSGLEAMIASSTRAIPVARTIVAPKLQANAVSAVTPIKATNTPTIVPATRSAVAGVETKKLDVVVNALPTPQSPALRAGVFATLLASPRNITTTIYLVLLGIVLLALGLAVFIKIRIQYPHIIANGLLLIAIISSLIIFNIAIGSWQGVI